MVFLILMRLYYPNFVITITIVFFFVVWLIEKATLNLTIIYTAIKKIYIYNPKCLAGLEDEEGNEKNGFGLQLIRTALVSPF